MIPRMVLVVWTDDQRSAAIAQLRTVGWLVEDRNDAIVVAPALPDVANPLAARRVDVPPYEIHIPRGRIIGSIIDLQEVP